MSDPKNKLNIRNKRASFDYEFIEEYDAGMVLTGTEIKSIRAGKASMNDSYCYFHRGELWCKGLYIAEYKLGTYYNHNERRERKLLLNKKELIKLERNVPQRIRMFIWLEGQDVDCVDSVRSSNFAVNIELAGGTQ